MSRKPLGFRPSSFKKRRETRKTRNSKTQRAVLQLSIEYRSNWVANVAQYLGLQGEEKPVERKSALSKTVNFNTKIVSHEIVTENGNSNININAYTASHLDVPTVKYDANEIKNQYQHFRDIPFCDITVIT